MFLMKKGKTLEYWEAPTCKNFIFGFKFVAPLPENTVVHVLGAEATYISPEESVSFLFYLRF